MTGEAMTITADAEPLATISDDGTVTWNPATTPSVIMAARLDGSLRVALLALWYATHPTGGGQ